MTATPRSRRSSPALVLSLASRAREAWSLWAAVLAVVAVALLARRPADRCWPRAQILAAIRMVESGGRSHPPDGDGGAAIGPYQIHRVYWEDAVRHAPGLGGRYADCRQRAYAERVIAAYMEFWAPEAWRAGHAEAIARVHNGGPQGARKAATIAYWQKVRARLEGR